MVTEGMTESEISKALLVAQMRRETERALLVTLADIVLGITQDRGLYPERKKLLEALQLYVDAHK